MEAGVVKWFNSDKGFGFIGREGASDCFLHVTELKKAGMVDSVKEGDRLHFETETTPRGVKAVNIKLVNGG